MIITMENYFLVFNLCLLFCFKAEKYTRVMIHIGHITPQ